MTKKELIKAFEIFDNDDVIVIQGSDGGWDNIEEVKYIDSTATITFGGGSPFSDE